jgi:hypothetical protein
MYAIKITRHYYGPRTVKSYVMTDDGQRRAEYATKAEAQAVADELDNAVYYTAHNEYGRADYNVVRIK